MPIHDWSQVDANVFHHFHQRWTIDICDTLNAELLPNGYSALVEQHAAGLVPDVLALQRRDDGAGISEPAGGLLTAIPPRTRHVFETSDQSLLARANRVAIRHRLGKLVGIIEIISPGNKAGRAAMRSFVEKTHEFLRAGVNVLIVDLFPPTPRDPQGIHKAVWGRVQDDDGFELPTDKPLTLVAYVAGDLSAGRSMRAYVEPVGVGDVLPDMPAYLDAEHYVPVPLERTYQTSWSRCPSDMRYLVEHGTLPDE